MELEATSSRLKTVSLEPRKPKKRALSLDSLPLPAPLALLLWLRFPGLLPLRPLPGPWVRQATKAQKPISNSRPRPGLPHKITAFRSDTHLKSTPVLTLRSTSGVAMDCCLGL